MYVEVKSANGISIEPIETSLLAKRIIILDKNIDAQTALEVIKQLIVLGKEKDEPIKMLIHSVGGEIDAGMMIQPNCLRTAEGSPTQQQLTRQLFADSIDTRSFRQDEQKQVVEFELLVFHK